MSTKTDGMIFFLAPFDNRISYLQKESLEDVNMLADYEKAGYKVKVIDNNPRIYVRLVHKSNTSLYVKPQRDYLVKGPNYSERFTNDAEKIYINGIKSYFRI